tara:strand:+ start:452 stop:1492 length:1041 start_codon:yes stop_codon:yes gene_type:complete
VACTTGVCNTAVHIDADGDHTVMVLADGRFAEWGDGTYLLRDEPPNGLVDVVSYSRFSTGKRECALFTGGVVRCRGNDLYGVLGNGPAGSTGTWSDTGLSGVVELAVGDRHNCARRSTGGITCWGSNASGQLTGSDSVLTSPGPDVALPGPAASVSAGRFHTCAVVASELWCWGANAVGQLGVDPTTTPSSSVPLRVAGLTNVARVFAGMDTTCVTLDDGRASCWGQNRDGQLGDGTRTSRWQPLVVPSLTNVSELAVGALHTCALRTDGSMRCWGDNYYGQLGNGTRTDSLFPTAAPLGAGGGMEVTVGTQYTCAIEPTGDVLCWGQGYGTSRGGWILTPTRVDW